VSHFLTGGPIWLKFFSWIRLFQDSIQPLRNKRYSAVVDYNMEKTAIFPFSAVTKVCAHLRLPLPFLNQWTDLAEIYVSDRPGPEDHFPL
jgi:hypothetical protein